MYGRILLPTDGSAFCEKAIQHGVRLAKALQANVVGVTVTAPLHTSLPRSLVPSHLASVIHEESEKLAKEKLVGVEAAARAAGVAVETMRIVQDHPWEGIIAAAKQKNCDLIVMASHGRSGISALVLGSEAQKVLTHAHIPVLVVR